MMTTKLLFDTQDLAWVFGYASRQSVLNSISKGRFPIPTFKRGGRRVASVEVVQAYFRHFREEGQRDLDERLAMMDER